jgi:hypothetical protein
MFQVCYRNSRTTWAELTLPRPDRCEADHSQHPSVFALVGHIIGGAMFRSDAGRMAIADPRAQQPATVLIAAIRRRAVRSGDLVVPTGSDIQTDGDFSASCFARRPVRSSRGDAINEETGQPWRQRKNYAYGRRQSEGGAA